MTVKIPLFQGSLENVVGSLQRWATELRKLPFLFTDDFESFTSWPCVPGADPAGGSYTAIKIFFARYLRPGNGSICFCQVSMTGTTASSPGFLTISLPFSGSSSLPGSQQVPIRINDGTKDIGAIYIDPGSNQGEVVTRTEAAWGNGAGREIKGNFFYSVD